MATLSPAQLQQLKTDITVTKAATVYLGQSLLSWWTLGADSTVADFYRQEASPVVNVWNPALPTDKLAQALVMSEFIAGGMTIAKQQGWFVLTQPATIDTTDPNLRQSFITIFGGSATTVANLLTLALRPASYGEALFSVASPAPGNGNISAIYGQQITSDNISAARTA